MGCDPETSSDEVQSNVKLASKLFEEHGDFIRTVTGLSLSDQSQVEDFCHDLFMYFVAKPIELENDKIRGLIFRIIKCRAQNWSRRVMGYRSLIQKYSAIKREDIPSKPTQTIADVYDIEGIYEVIENYLFEAESTAILLRYRDHHNTEETAEIMGVKSESVRRYVSVGLKKLRNHLQKKKEVEP